MRYRKKPVVIEAFQMTKERRWNNQDWPSWLHLAWSKDRDKEGALQVRDTGEGTGELLDIVSLEGKHHVSWGDYIIQGIKGELYACKPDIFETTYELAE